MTPETKARQQIDQKLEQAGWVIQDMKQLNLGAAVDVAVREYPTDTDPADYVLFVNRQAVGVIEVKKDSAGENLTVVEDQTQRYATANLKWRRDNTPLRFLFEATGQIVRFTDNADPAPRSLEIFHFFKPETLAAWLAQTETLRRRLAEQMPALPERNLRDCQISAVTGLEKSLALNKPRALVHKAQARIEKISGGIPVGELGKGLIAALNPDAIVQAALATAKANGITRSEDTLLPEEIEAARAQRVAAACVPFDKPELRDELEAVRCEREQLIDHINLDQVTFSGFSEQAETQAKAVIQTFADYIAQHKDEIAALGFFYQQPYQRRALTFDMPEDLHAHLSKPPWMLTTGRLWSAYARVQTSSVKSADCKRQLTDLVLLLRIGLPLPPRTEQTRIVAKLEELLSDLDAGVAELKAAQKKLAQYRQSLLKAAVEGALTAEWRANNSPSESGTQLLQRILHERRARQSATGTNSRRTCATRCG